MDTRITDNKENQMQITIDTNNLSELDISMLAFLAGGTEEAEEVESTPAPVKVKKTKAPAPAPELEPETEEDLVDGDAPTMADAVAAATVLVSEGGAAKVKAALAVVGAKRVSEMDDADIPAFLAALEAE